MKRNKPKAKSGSRPAAGGGKRSRKTAATAGRGEVGRELGKVQVIDYEHGGRLYRHVFKRPAALRVVNQLPGHLVLVGDFKITPAGIVG